jgi:hypothetical protein
MIESGILQGVLAGAHVDPSVFALRPDYRAMLLAVGGLAPGPSDQESDALLQAAEDAARQALASGRWSSSLMWRRGGRRCSSSTRSTR